MRKSNSTIIAGKFNISISTMDKTINKINKETENLSNIYKPFRIKAMHEHSTENAYI